MPHLDYKDKNYHHRPNYQRPGHHRHHKDHDGYHDDHDDRYNDGYKRGWNRPQGWGGPYSGSYNWNPCGTCPSCPSCPPCGGYPNYQQRHKPFVYYRQPEKNIPTHYVPHKHCKCH